MQTVEKRRRRPYTTAFKAAAVAANGKPGASVAAVALELQLNGSMLRVWTKRSRSGESKRVDPGRAMSVPGSPTVSLPAPLADRTRDRERLKRCFSEHLNHGVEEFEDSGSKNDPP
jgi:transposase-like protein